MSIKLGKSFIKKKKRKNETGGYASAYISRINSLE